MQQPRRTEGYWNGMFFSVSSSTGLLLRNVCRLGRRSTAFALLLAVYATAMLLAACAPGKIAEQPPLTSSPGPVSTPAGDGPIYSLAWSPNGKTIAAVAQKGIILIDAISLFPIRTLDSNERAGSVAYSPDGALLACTCGEGLIRIWDAETGNLLKSRTDDRGFTGVAYSPDGQRIAAGTRGGTVKVFDASGEKLLLALPGPAGDVEALAYSPDGRRLLAGSSQTGTARVWNAASGEVILAFPDDGEFLGIVYSPDGTRMATSNVSGNPIKVWDVQSGALLATIPTEIARFTFTRDSQVLVTAGKQGLVAWDASSGKSLGTIEPFDPSLYAIGFSPDGKRLAIGTRDGSIKTIPWSLPAPMPPTPTLHPSILDVFPLRLGATWVYSATIETAENQKPIRWSGTITETVTGVREQGGALIFDLERQGRPAASGFGLSFNQYIALDNRLYRVRPPILPESLIARQGQGYDALQALVWPMSVGDRWGDSRDMMRNDGMLIWRVEEIKDLKTPAGAFPGCYRLLYLTNPDDTTVWFCPGVGIARTEYHHHGSIMNETWELQERIP